ncbi:Tryprostatin B 6-hydroxylase [Cytospora mali]|uniref:Tryprostatin B 6-hydroxylase n=1 Tax=Cytospora mali TaxID=578113 RepID=A0A194V923_CYTMA|nr:Tryprostatin B 6-hydroxylase [Valsa mali var. pyri (nom. inval.)]
MLSPEVILSFLFGVSLHVFVLRHGEWDSAVTELLATAGAAPLALSLVLLYRTEADWWSAMKTSSSLVATVIFGIYLSMLVYRAAFHRLNRFPGPFLARLSNFYFAVVTFKKHQEYIDLDNLHKKYGDVVRIGASTLSIADPRALQAVHLSTKCVKGPWYNVLAPERSLQTERDQAKHAARRKVWDRGFSTKALRNYESRVSYYSDKLLAHIGSASGVPVDASLWFNFYSFDVMGDLSLGRSFEMLDSGKAHFFMKALHEFMFMVGVFSHIMWAFRTINATPIVNSASVKFKAWVKESLQKRMDNPPDIPDVFSWIIDEYKSHPQPTQQQTMDLRADGILIAIAGSDTTAAALTYLFMELATHPDVTRALQEELDTLFQEDPEPDANALSKLKYLQACIDEALRIQPVVPSGLQRVTPPEGLQIGDDLFIPGDMMVQIPTYTLHRGRIYFDS